MLLLWIKMFYWLRLFDKTRYFIKLIVATLVDVQKFFYIILVIMMAFISIFYVISCNQIDNDELKDSPYLKDYTGSRAINAVITVYFIMVGEFYFDNYNKGPNSVLLWPLFLVCNFLMAVIFMNMIIAIMSSTYSEVSSTKLQSEMEQKIALISDYFNLIDIKKIFNDKKYIIVAKPAETETFHEVNLEENIEDLGN